MLTPASLKLLLVIKVIKSRKSSRYAHAVVVFSPTCLSTLHILIVMARHKQISTIQLYGFALGLGRQAVIRDKLRAADPLLMQLMTTALENATSVLMRVASRGVAYLPRPKQTKTFLSETPAVCYVSVVFFEIVSMVSEPNPARRAGGV